MQGEPGRHEQSDVNVRGILIALGMLLAGAVIINLVLTVHFEVLRRARVRDNPPPSPLAAAAPEAPPEPRLQSAPERDLAELRASEAVTLDSYGWVDRSAGVVRISVARAMELLAAEARR